MRADGTFGVDIGRPADLSCTAMVGLTLLSQGNTPVCGPRRAELRRITDAILNAAEKVHDRSGSQQGFSLVQRKIGRNADLFLSALFLSQVLGEAADADADVRRNLERLVTIICQARERTAPGATRAGRPCLAPCWAGNA